MRLFTTIEPPEDLLPQLAALCQGVTSIRWSDPNQLHLTLVFIGEVPDEQLEPIATVLSRIDFPAFECQCHGVGFFRSGTLWLGIEPCQPLLELQSKQRQLINRFLPVRTQSRRYHPHITLGRFQRHRKPDLDRYINHHRDLQLRFPVNRYVLKSSRLLSQGAQHRSEYEFLAG